MLLYWKCGEEEKLGGEVNLCWELTFFVFFFFSFHDVFVKIVKIWFFGALTFPRTATERTHHPLYKRWLRVARLKSWENTGLTFWRLTFSTKDNRKNVPPVLCTVGARPSVEIWRKNRFCHFTEKTEIDNFLFVFVNPVCIFFVCECLIICGQKALGYSTRR